MASLLSLVSEGPKVLNVGTRLFYEGLKVQGVPAVQLDWHPPATDSLEVTEALFELERDEVDQANAKAVKILIEARPVLMDVRPAGEVIPGMNRKLILHAGPPIEWDRMCGPMRGAVIGALLYEGIARSEAEALEAASSGEIQFRPCHEHASVGPMAGIISASMPVFVIQNATHGNVAYCTINEGLGKVLRYGAYERRVIDRLRWIEEELGPALGEAVRLIGGIDLRLLISQALHMGDECHNRNKAGTSLFYRAVAPLLAEVVSDRQKLSRILRFIDSNDHFFLNLTMPACKSAADAASGIKFSTMVTAMARNGVEFGIRVSGLGNTWFTGVAQVVDGLFFPGFSAEDANPDIGDSAITETCGLGGFSMAAAPAIVQFVGGSVKDALRFSKRMYEITLAENPNYTIPNLGFRGAPTGIDVRRVVETAILPQINTGIAHKQAGVGQVGAGLVNPPLEPFLEALVSVARDFSTSN